ncbi:MAG: SpoIIE family protein phosphatase, partial [Lachnospiraceae bacterium]|nr:SpoIIE family protein phosphatase [Lachnospiraceae bacterium]
DSQGSCEHCKALKRQNIIYKNKLKDSRRVIATQLQEIARILGESVDDTYDFHSISNEQMGLLTSRLRDAGIVLKRAVRLDNRRGISEIIVTMKAKRGKCVSVKEVTRIINLVFDKDTEIVKEKRRVIGTDMDTYRFKERPNFYVLHGLAKTSYDDVSGDNFTFVSLDSGQTLLGISDGMGTGVRAYKDSEMVLELIENLMESGFGEETTLKLVNTLFVLEGEDLSPATVDMSIIDMYSGVCDFLKLGAAATYVKRGDWVEALRSTSLPIGGEECLDIESATKKLYDGDFVIMMSDGIIETAAKLNKEEEIGKLILEAKPGKPQEMADRILNDAIHLLGDVKEDDMTVFVTGIWNYGTCIA